MNTHFCICARSSMIVGLITLTCTLQAQNVAINTTGDAPDSSAILDISSDSMGLLIPRVSLTSTSDITTVASAQTSLLVYNTATIADVTPGFYYWDGSMWAGISTIWKRSGPNIYYDEGNVGIGTEMPTGNLEVVRENGVASMFATTYRSDDEFNAGQFVGRGARGTMDSPTAVMENDMLASFNGRGYGDSSFSDRPRGRIGIMAAEHWTDTTQGTHMLFETTPIGTTANTERMRITSEGRIGIGTSNPDHRFEIASDQEVSTILLTTYRNSGFSAGQFQGRGARGTQDAPSAVQVNDWLAVFSGKGYGSTGFGGTPPAARIGIMAAESFTDTSQGTVITFQTTPVGVVGLQERMRITAEGNIGIGTESPARLLEVVGNSGASGTPIAYFENTCDTVDGQLVDAFGIMGVCDRSDWAGYGVYGRGGFIGVRGRVNPIDTFSYYGMHGQASGGAGENFGVEGVASGDGRNFGVRGRAFGGHTNYGIYGQAETSGVYNTYAGYFEGDAIVTGRLGVGVDNPSHKLEVLGNSGASQTPIAYFENTCDTVNGQLVDAYGVMGVCNKSDFAGYGGYFKGGYIGALGEVTPTDTFVYFGIRGIVNGGAGNNYGLHGFAGGDGTNIGVRGRADGPGANSGVWGYATGGLTNYAVRGAVDTSGVEGTYAGYFLGDTYISSSLGIGTETPDYKLQVDGHIVPEMDNAYNLGADTLGWDTLFMSSTIDYKSDLSFTNGGSEHVVLTTGGNVGIGTTSPNELLEVNGGLSGEYFGISINQNAYGSGYPTLFFRDENDNHLASIFTHQNRTHLYFRLSTGDFVFDRSPSTDVHMIIKESGKVGIGTTTPDEMLHIGGSMRLDNSFEDKDGDAGSAGQILSSTGTGTDWIAASSIDDGDWTISDTNMYSSVIGNIGIGTSSPAAKLDVNGDSRIEGNLSVGNTTVDKHISFSGTVGDGIIKMYTSGDFAMGSDAGVKMRISTGDDFKIQTYTGTFQDRFYVANDGDVGVSTSSPTAKLDVNGATGYDQLRMRTSYTPTGTGDTNGNIGDIAWDDTYMYIKTSAGWKRTAVLSTF